ncbi:MAG: M23 family metallopeptidase [Flavobacteriales bacterium]|nr:M23 family metallopeptidase [Flavobacteriales bacterium]
MDHNPTPNNNLTDWNCGTRTYDWSSGNHMGTDIILWPYAWRRMQEGVMEVVAAAPGTIVTRRDGYYDTQCSNSGQTTWNGIVLQHADGSTTIYMHFKNGSVTSKVVGETVEEGEYLGRAAAAAATGRTCTSRCMTTPGTTSTPSQGLATASTETRPGGPRNNHTRCRESTISARITPAMSSTSALCRKPPTSRAISCQAIH